MIYSSIDENWMRVELMHSIAEKYFHSACKVKESKKKLLFNLEQYDYEQKEICFCWYD